MANRLPTLLLCLLAAACGDKEGADSGHDHHHHHHGGDRDAVTSIDTDSWTVSYAVPGGDIPLSEEFALEVTVHAAGDPASPATSAEVAVTAIMPDHDHGMNQEPTVTANGDGTFTADGMLFHMSGYWEIIVDVTADGSMETARLGANCCD